MDDHVDTSVLCHGPIHGTFDIGREGHVYAVGSHGRTGSRNLCGSVLVDVGDDDQGAPLCVETAYDRRAYPGGSARDQGDLSREAIGV
jgi:hypothetical protein